MNETLRTLESELKSTKDALKCSPWSACRPMNGIKVYQNKFTKQFTDNPGPVHLGLLAKLAIIRPDIKKVKEDQLISAVRSLQVHLMKSPNINSKSSIYDCQTLFQNFEFLDLIPHDVRDKVLQNHILKLQKTTPPAECLEEEIVAFDEEPKGIIELEAEIEAWTKMLKDLFVSKSQIAFDLEEKEKQIIMLTGEIESLSQMNKELLDAENQSDKREDASELRKETSGTTQFTCIICMDTFGTRKLYYAHRRQVHSDKTETCDCCQRRFPHKRSLSSHLVNKSFPLMHCQIRDCSFSSPLKRYHIQHLKSRHNPEEESVGNLIIRLNRLKADYKNCRYVER